MTMDQLNALAHSSGFPRVSIYIPTHRTWPDTQQDPIRLSNRLKEAESQLEQAGVKEIEDILAPARDLIANDRFWSFQDEGLAFFLERSGARWLKLPSQVNEMTVVGGRYHVLPLIDIFSDPGRFHLLTATRDEIRFFDATGFELDQVDIEDLPSSLAEIRGQTDLDADVGFHARAGGSSAAPQYHALGEAAEDYEETELEAYAGAIAKAVDRHLSDHTAPLVLAAEPRLLGRLRQQLRYRNTIGQHIARDPAAMSEAELHAEAWQIAEEALRHRHDEICERWKAREGGADIPGSSDLEALMRAAEEGRIEALLLSPGTSVWGHYDDQSRELQLADAAGPDNEDLLNLLAVRTIAQGGEVVPLCDDGHKRGRPAAAGLYRY